MGRPVGVLERFRTRIGPLAKGQRGVTGLETAIILIAFVVVASSLRLHGAVHRHLLCGAR